ncbi:Transmembrane nucleoporin [Microsporum ferrugineum]
MLAQTLQFAWFIGHFTLILAVFRYVLACVTFRTYTTFAQASYRFAFVAAAATYGIVVYKGYVARGRLGGSIPNDIIKLAGDENVQYLGMALVWLCSRQLLFALLPFAIYSFFHVATYTRTYLIPTFQPSPDAGPASPSGRPAAGKSSPLADKIGRFVKTYYDTSMAMVAALELSLLIRLIFTALTFSSGSWLLLVIYFWFFRSRYTQSSFVQAVVVHSTARIDATLSHQSTPPAVRQGWEVVKNAVRKLYNVTDLKPYLARFQQQAPGKKPQ